MTLEEKADLLIASSVTIFDWERYAETVKNEDAELTGLARYVQGKVIALLAVVQSGTDIPDWLFNRVLQEAATFELTSV